MSDKQKAALEIEMHYKIKRVSEILSKLKSVQGGGGSGYLIKRSEISNDELAIEVLPFEQDLCLKSNRVWVIIVPRL